MKTDEVAYVRDQLSAFAGDKPPVSYQLAKNITLADRVLKERRKVLEALQDQHLTKGDDGRVKTFKNDAGKEEYFFPDAASRKGFIDAKKEFDDEELEVSWHVVTYSKVSEFIEKEKVDANHYSGLLGVVLIEEDAKAGESAK
jgi:hypothetical protein